MGSVCGALASLMEYKYHHKQSRLEQTKQTTHSLWNRVTEPVNEIVTNYGNKVIDRSFAIVNESRGMVGCSSSVYALYALDFCLCIDRSKKRLKKFWKKYIMQDSSIEITQSEAIHTFFDMLSLYTGIERIRYDLEYLWKDKLNRTKIDHLIVASPDNIAHSSHIGGFIAGLMTFCAWKAYRRWKYAVVYDEARSHWQSEY